MKKFKEIISGILGVCFVVLVLGYSFKRTFFHNVKEDVERKQEQQRYDEEREYQEMSVWADAETFYYHLDPDCKGVHESMTDEMPLWKAEQEGYEPCHFCAE